MRIIHLKFITKTYKLQDFICFLSIWARSVLIGMCIGNKYYNFELLNDSLSLPLMIHCLSHCHSLHWGIWVISIQLLILFPCRGCRDGSVVRALTSHQCGPGSIPRSASNVGWVGWFSTLHWEVFSRNSGFPSPQKPKFDLIVLIVNLSYSVCN